MCPKLDPTRLNISPTPQDSPVRELLHYASYNTYPPFSVQDGSLPSKIFLAFSDIPPETCERTLSNLAGTLPPPHEMFSPAGLTQLFFLAFTRLQPLLPAPSPGNLFFPLPPLGLVQSSFLRFPPEVLKELLTVPAPFFLFLFLFGVLPIEIPSCSKKVFPFRTSSSSDRFH